MPLTIGSRLGPYEILTPIGAGGMGEVYRARDTKLDRDVAIKVLPAAFASDADRLARFTREAKTLAALNHPNIAQIYGIEGNALVMELVDGDDLSILIAGSAGPKGPALQFTDGAPGLQARGIPVSDALAIAKQIADALEAAHELGIVHRDLKPANIKVRTDGTVKVLDFGLAKAMDPAAASSVGVMNSPTLTTFGTQMGMIIGTAAYMAPEQARGKSVDKRADVWAFGVVLYEMLTGKRAFAGEEISDVLAAVLRQDVDWTALPADTPLRLRRLLERCLDRDVKQRLRDIGEARVEIAKIEHGAPDVVSGVAPATGIPGAGWRRALPWGLSGALAIAVVALSISKLQPAAEPAALVRFEVVAPSGSTRQINQSFALSPDGQAIAYRAVGADGVGRILTRRLDQSDEQPIVGSENAAAPFWSPDSRSLGFQKDGVLYRTDLAGGVPRRLCDVPGDHGRIVGPANWGPNGVIVFPSNGSGLFRVSDSGGVPAPLTSLNTANGEATHTSPWFLPDGRHVLFLALAAAGIEGDIWAVSIDDSTRTRLARSNGGAAYSDGWLFTTTGGVSARSLVAQKFDAGRLTVLGQPELVRDRLYSPTTSGLAGFSVSSHGVIAADRYSPVIHQLAWMDRAGRMLSTVGPAAVVREFALAPDERRVVASVVDTSSLKGDLWIFDSQNESGSRLTFQGGATRPMWSLDGRRLFFTSVPNFALRSMAIGSTESEAFENPGGFIHFEDATRDGRYLLMKSPTPAKIWLQRVGGPAERRLLVTNQFSSTQARVSPDGRWVAYTVTSSGDRPEIFVQPFDRAGDRQQVSRTGGMGAIWKGDSRELFYEGRDGLMSVSMTDRGGALDIGTPQRLFPLRTQGYVTNQPHNVQVTSDGKRFLVNTIVGSTDNAPIEVTLNWMKGLKK